eukprot:CAMPEP_0116976266 /NCGR_PEP_ID=MMETSP0467-20121206/56369_1 /TAXON_ID=283647 /ORGANISM="Mesodinium pulex, Strain SPMC105" /LENGTH=437 /DNA_ID=CAMNT_0004668983 /DNA_START=1 /DNA_END=1311 /DNA_ORIENTATION=+
MVGGVIFANALIIGAETDNKSSWWAYVENFLLTFFVMELLLRMLHFGCSNFLRQFGNLFDLFIVLSGVFDMWFVPIYHFMAGKANSESTGGLMSAIQMLRLLRIVRLVRLVKIIQPLYRLALGIAEALQGMFWVLVFLMMMLYAIAIVLTRLLGRHISVSYEEEKSAWGVSNVPADRAELTRSMFHSVPSSMFVLFESMSCWSLVQFIPLFTKFPFIQLMSVMFYIFSVWALLAVMTGVVSEKMIAVREAITYEERNGKPEQEEVVEALAEVFNKADADGSGEISKEEFTAMLMWTDISKHLVAHLGVNNQDLNQLFDWLDKDKDGVIDIDEFVNGLFWLNNDINPKSLLKLQEELAVVMRSLQVQLCDHANKRFDDDPRRLAAAGKNPSVTEQIQRLDLQLSTNQGTNKTDTIHKDRLYRGPTTKQELAKMERRVG